MLLTPRLSRGHLIQLFYFLFIFINNSSICQRCQYTYLTLPPPFTRFKTRDSQVSPGPSTLGDLARSGLILQREAPAIRNAPSTVTPPYRPPIPTLSSRRSSDPFYPPSPKATSLIKSTATGRPGARVKGLGFRV